MGSVTNWPVYAQELSDAGVVARAAAHARDLDALLTAGDQLVETCERCHTGFKPQLPSEGIAHPH